ncbi:glycosyltransferase family 2 protein [Vibrio cholerae]|uniref:glycosyltransferase family 2 protein n=1 Tax=Vibrio cholerae TaxID=666 RepID=UPI0006E5DEF1|nr:glycosyltransferase family 2 protein [Vibrio cholerae]KQA30825.1 hypothetical protein XV73_17010 [Vibrio cholerae]KQA41605.1 hypothetical protein XV76_15085 [Vibrio cholerae]KQA63801.1 hypothetical protein XV82_17025 [Vibrio cholerae]KQA80313.1 hypothetical protein XV87_16950 [Vibrio cholerae]KQA94387.1 hypothetical protein XV89_02385 [Vibrio cholerae]
MINIFILNWNSTNDIDNLLNSLKKSNNQLFRIILIHNGSDDWMELLSLSEKYEHCFEIHIIKNNDNLGYAEGNNTGLYYIDSHGLLGDILVVNPDVIFCEDSIDELIFAKNHLKNIGAVMIRTFNHDNVLLYDKIKLNGFSQQYVHLVENQINVTDYCAGSCMLISRDAVAAIGLFESDYFLYWEEVDLSLRLRDAGYVLITTTRSHIIRKCNSIERTSNAYYYYLRNSFIIKRRWPVGRGIVSHGLFILRSLSSALLNSISKNNLAFLTNSIKGIADGIREKYGKRA